MTGQKLLLLLLSFLLLVVTEAAQPDSSETASLDIIALAAVMSLMETAPPLWQQDSRFENSMPQPETTPSYQDVLVAGNGGYPPDRGRTSTNYSFAATPWLFPPNITQGQDNRWVLVSTCPLPSALIICCPIGKPASSGQPVAGKKDSDQDSDDKKSDGIGSDTPNKNNDEEGDDENPKRKPVNQESKQGCICCVCREDINREEDLVATCCGSTFVCRDCAEKYCQTINRCACGSQLKPVYACHLCDNNKSGDENSADNAPVYNDLIDFTPHLQSHTEEYLGYKLCLCPVAADAVAFGNRKLLQEEVKKYVQVACPFPQCNGQTFVSSRAFSEHCGQSHASSVCPVSGCSETANSDHLMNSHEICTFTFCNSSFHSRISAATLSRLLCMIKDFSSAIFCTDCDLSPSNIHDIETPIDENTFTHHCLHAHVRLVCPVKGCGQNYGGFDLDDAESHVQLNHPPLEPITPQEPPSTTGATGACALAQSTAGSNGASSQPSPGSDSEQAAEGYSPAQSLAEILASVYSSMAVGQSLPQCEFCGYILIGTDDELAEHAQNCNCLH
ncbi:MAG: hypothetical protein ACR2PT_11375 [Endozoicomonas sp.]